MLCLCILSFVFLICISPPSAALVLWSRRCSTPISCRNDATQRLKLAVNAPPLYLNTKDTMIQSWETGKTKASLAPEASTCKDHQQPAISKIRSKNKTTPQLTELKYQPFYLNIWLANAGLPDRSDHLQYTALLLTTVANVFSGTSCLLVWN